MYTQVTRAGKRSPLLSMVDDLSFVTNKTRVTLETSQWPLTYGEQTGTKLEIQADDYRDALSRVEITPGDTNEYTVNAKITVDAVAIDTGVAVRSMNIDGDNIVASMSDGKRMSMSKVGLGPSFVPALLSTNDAKQYIIVKFESGSREGELYYIRTDANSLEIYKSTDLTTNLAPAVNIRPSLAAVRGDTIVIAGSEAETVVYVWTGTNAATDRTSDFNPSDLKIIDMSSDGNIVTVAYNDGHSIRQHDGTTFRLMNVPVRVDGVFAMSGNVWGFQESVIVQSVNDTWNTLRTSDELMSDGQLQVIKMGGRVGQVVIVCIDYSSMQVKLLLTSDMKNFEVAYEMPMITGFTVPSIVSDDAHTYVAMCPGINGDGLTTDIIAIGGSFATYSQTLSGSAVSSDMLHVSMSREGHVGDDIDIMYTGTNPVELSVEVEEDGELKYSGQNTFTGNANYMVINTATPNDDLHKMSIINSFSRRVRVKVSPVPMVMPRIGGNSVNALSRVGTSVVVASDDGSVEINNGVNPVLAHQSSGVKWQSLWTSKDRIMAAGTNASESKLHSVLLDTGGNVISEANATDQGGRYSTAVIGHATGPSMIVAANDKYLLTSTTLTEGDSIFEHGVADVRQSPGGTYFCLMRDGSVRASRDKTMSVYKSMKSGVSGEVGMFIIPICETLVYQVFNHRLAKSTGEDFSEITWGSIEDSKSLNIVDVSYYGTIDDYIILFLSKVGTLHRVIRYDGVAFSEININKINDGVATYNAIEFTPDNRLWIGGSDGKLYRMEIYDDNNAAYYRMTKSDSDGLPAWVIPVVIAIAVVGVIIALTLGMIRLMYPKVWDKYISVKHV